MNRDLVGGFLMGAGVVGIVSGSKKYIIYKYFLGSEG
jgi:hypothetical protein